MHDSLPFAVAACVQFPISMGEPEQNIRQVEDLIDGYRPVSGTLLLLPEMWATGFDYARTVELGQRTPEILEVMQQMAARHQVFLAGTLTALPEDGGLPLNMLFLVGPEGVIGRLPKQHLFSSWQEDRFYQGGRTTPLLQTPSGAFGAMVCYDLRFPEVARRQVFAGGRLLVVSAQWPLSRLDHWQTLLRARAIENQVYVVATNSCGHTGTMELGGHSMIIGPDGRVLQAAGTEATVIGCPLDNALIEEQRRTFYPAGNRSWRTDDRQKIRSLDHLLPELALIRRQGSRIAFTNGDFQILRADDVDFLEQSRRTADCLVVGLRIDCTIPSQQGASCPLNSDDDRARVLAALGCVDYVVLFDAATPLRLITALMPDVLIENSNLPEEKIAGAAEIAAFGGRVVRIPFQDDRSTPDLINTRRATEKPCPVGKMATAQLKNPEERP